MRPHRRDEAGSWHHVMNRAVARRPMFETRRDIRFFLAGLARAVRRGEIAVHAYTVLFNHYHLLVQSPCGNLSAAMHRVQACYARHFNRTRGRDGPLFRGRFRSKPVTSVTYRWRLVRYIDGNPVEAGLCRAPCEYEWGSARHYAAHKGPPWLSRGWVEAVVSGSNDPTDYDPEDYPRAFDTAAFATDRELVEAGFGASNTSAEVDSLLAMADPAVLDWLQQAAVQADGPGCSPPTAPASVVSAVLAEQALERGPWIVRGGRRRHDAWQILHAGLLRTIARLAFPAIGQRLGTHAATGQRLAARHRRLLQDVQEYAGVATAITRAILDATYASDDLHARDWRTR